MTNSATVNLGAPPRRVKWTGAIKTRIGAYLLGAIIGAVAIGIAYVASRNEARLAQSGKMTSASVITSHASHGKTTSYFLSLFYLDGLKSYDPDIEVSHDEYFQYLPGSSVDITYLPTDHDVLQIGQVTEENARRTHGYFVDVTVVTLLLELLILGALERRMRQEHELLEHGQIAQATVTSIREYTYRTTVTHRVAYEFQVNGSTYRDIYTGDGPAVSGPQAGATMDILYDPVHLKHHKPFAQMNYVGLA